jgi:uncharacterized protein DUF5670
VRPPCCYDRRQSLRSDSLAQEAAMLWGIIVVLLVLWLLGFLVIPVGGALIHLLLVIALIVLVYQLVTGRRGI